MATKHQHETIIDYNLRIAQHMDIKSWKLLKGALMSLLVAGFAAFAMLQGADPTKTALAALGIIAVLNGVELQELAAVKGIQIVRQHGQDDDREERQ